MTQLNYDPDGEENGLKGQKNNSRTITVALIIVGVFVLILVLFLYLIRRPALFGSFAQTESEITTTTSSEPSVISPQSVSHENSYLFASPLKATVGFERVRVTVYVLDGQGMGIAGKNVTLGNIDKGLQIFTIASTTDDFGRATFDVSANQAGLFLIEASVDGKALSQRVTVSFE